MDLQDKIDAESIKMLYEKQYPDKKPSLPAYKEVNLKIGYTEDDEFFADQPSASTFPFATSNIVTTFLQSVKVFLHEENATKSVYEVTLGMKESGLKFNPGDTIGVLTHNKTEEVDFIIKRLDLTDKADKCYHLEPKVVEKKSPLPVFIPLKSTIRHVLTYCVEIRSLVKKLFLLALSKHTSHPEEKKALEILCSKEGSEIYNEFILKQSISLLHILKSFPSCKPPLTILLAHLPRLPPRPYSIVNSQNSNKDSIKICFSVLKGKNKGLATGWLEELIVKKIKTKDLSEQLEQMTLEDDSIQIYLRKNMGFSLPENMKKPMIMVCIGTGVAPFIGFLQERKFMKEGNVELGKAWLIYGCKKAEHCFYSNELESFVNDNVLDNFLRCYSASDGVPKTYVQDEILKNCKEIIDMLSEGGILYVCGDLNTIAKEIESAITLCYEKVMAKSKEESQLYIKHLKQDKQYVIDAWS